MKRLTALFLIFTIALSFVSCSSTVKPSITADVKADAIVTAAVNAYDASLIPDSVYFKYGESADSENYLDPDAAGSYFYGAFAADMGEFDTVIKDYALHMPATKNVFEIDVLVAESEAEVSKATAFLEARLKVKNNGEIANYTPEEMPLLEAAEIYTLGRYAILLATTDNKIARGVIADMLTSAESGDEYDLLESDTTRVLPEGVIELPSVTEIPLGGGEAGQDSPKDNTGRSDIPDITFVKHVENDLVLIGGRCAEDAVIFMRGGEEDLEWHNDYGSFCGGVRIPDGGSCVVEVTASQPGKEESLPYLITLTARTDVNYMQRMGGYYHYVADNLQCFTENEFADFTHSNVMQNRQEKTAQKLIEKRVDSLTEIGAELIYLIVPCPIRIYSEKAPGFLTEGEGESRTDQFVQLATDAGATVINLYDTFLAHKNDEFKLYHRTDTHWTGYGAYLGCVELMNHISLKWPEAAPRTLDEVIPYSEWTNMGDLAEHTESDPSLLQEYATFIKFGFNNQFVEDIYYDGNCRLNHSVLQDSRITRNTRTEELPTAYIMRDSFGSPIYSLLSDAFSKVYWQPMWSYEFNLSSISKASPDYVIYVITERNLDVLFS